MDKRIRLTVDEFEALLFEIYKNGFDVGAHTSYYNLGQSPYEHQLKKHFDDLMFKLKLRTQPEK